ncbi:DUF2795 domain-containing protein [Myxococcaceae bacterium GXIMD 01537]
MTDDLRRAQLSRGVEAPEGREGQSFPLAQPLDAALRGAVFPLSAEQLVRVARENEAPATVLSLLSALPSRQYPSLDGVTRALGGAPDPAPLDAESAPVPHR